MKKRGKWLKKNWLWVLASILALVAAIFIYTSRISSLTHGISSSEQTYILLAETTPNILKNSVFMPHKILVDVAQKVQIDARYVSAMLSVVFIVFFYSLCSRWQTRRIAILSTLLFASSSWLLVIGRQALPTIMYVSWLPLIALLFWTITKKKHTTASFLWAVAGSLAFYVPGLLWFVLVLGYTQKRRLLALAKQLPKWQIGVSWGLFVFLLVPFFAMLFSDPSLAAASLGFPTGLEQFKEFPRTLIYNIFNIFIYGQPSPLFRLGNLPYLDIVSALLFLVGVYRLRYAANKKLLRISSILIGIWVIGIGLNSINAAVLLPVIYIFVGSGLGFLLVQWHSVFPKNHVARLAGATAIVIVSLLIVQHHLYRYFIAWPNNPQTRAIFSSQSVKME